MNTRHRYENNEKKNCIRAIIASPYVIETDPPIWHWTVSIEVNGNLRDVELDDYTSLSHLPLTEEDNKALSDARSIYRDWYKRNCVSDESDSETMTNSLFGEE